MKIIRWKAVIPTLIILGLVVVFTIFFLDGIIKKTVINTGESIFGAKVEIAELSIKLKNMSIEIKGLQIASKEDVWKNLVEAEKISFAMQPLPLLSKKVIIEEMRTEGIKWGTKRSSSGALPPRKKKKLEKKKKKEKPGITDKLMASLKKKANAEVSNIAAISNIKSIQKNMKDFDAKKAVNIANLSSLKEIENMKSSLAEKEAKYKSMADEINVDAKTKEISDIIEGLKDIKIKSAADIPAVREKILKLKNAKKSTEKLLKQIKTAKNDISSDFGEEKDLIKKINGLKNADYKNIMSKLSIGDLSAGNISKSLIGPLWIGRVGKAVYYIKLVRKYIPKSKKKKIVKKRLKGMDVAFEKENELPGFLIEKIIISGTTGGEGKDNAKAFDFSGNVSNITSNPVLWGQPTRAKISGKKKKRRFKLDLLFDHTKDISKDVINISMNGMTPKDINIENLGDILFIEDGNVEFDVRFELAGDKLNARAETKMKNTKFGKAENENETQKLFRQMLKNVKEIWIRAQLVSKEDDFDFKVKSNLDDILKQGVKSLVGEKLAEAKARIRAEINKQVAAKQKELLGNLTGKKAELLKNLTSKEQFVSSKKAEVQNKIDSSQKEITKQGRKKVEDKLKKTLKGLFGK